MVWMRTALDMALGTEGVGQASAAGGVAISREALHRGVLKAPEPAGSEVRDIVVYFVPSLRCTGTSYVNVRMRFLKGPCSSVL